MRIVVTEVAERLPARPQVFGKGRDPTLNDRSRGSVVRASDNTHTVIRLNRTGKHAENRSVSRCHREAVSDTG
jgi:hypothetical protein